MVDPYLLSFCGEASLSLSLAVEFFFFNNFVYVFLNRKATLFNWTKSKSSSTNFRTIRVINRRMIIIASAVTEKCNERERETVQFVFVKSCKFHLVTSCIRMNLSHTNINFHEFNFFELRRSGSSDHSYLERNCPSKFSAFQASNTKLSTANKLITAFITV